jgi:putative tricarboxylic transport membrane protein
VRAPGGQLAVAAGVLAIGAFVLGGSFFMPTGGGYAQVGPGVVPRVVGILLLLLAALLAREALTGGFRGVDEAAERAQPMDWRAFAWVSAGILVYGIFVERAGFIISSTVLFILVARGFGSRRWLPNALIGLALAALIFAIFNYGLGLTLPPGVFRGIV